MKFKDELVQEGIFVIQLGVPHSVYGSTTYFPPKVIDEWLKERNLRGDYVGGHLSGDGFTNGISNAVSNYMITDAHEHDGLALGLRFPECSLYITKKFGYD